MAEAADPRPRCDELWESTIYNSALEMKLRDNPGGVMRCLSRDAPQQFGQDLHGAGLDAARTFRGHMDAVAMSAPWA